MNNKVYGYVRVSSTDQNEDRQLHALIKEKSKKHAQHLVSHRNRQPNN